MADERPPEWPTGPGISESDAVSRMEGLFSEGANDAEAPAERPARNDGAGQADEEGSGRRGESDDRSDAGPDDAESADGGGERDDQGEGNAEAEGGEDAPDFWSAEDKAWWKQVPPELRPVLKKYEAQRIEFANRKAQEAAEASKKAADEVHKLGSTSEQYATWWQQNAQKFEQTFVNRWAAVDFNKLAADNPAEWARLSQMRADEHAMLQQAASQAQDAQRVTQARARDQLQSAKLAAHTEVARKLPDYFGTSAKAEKTYAELGTFLHSKGFSADRINQISEASLIEMALNAMRFEQGLKRASTVTSSGAANNPGNATPKRVEPGPAQRRGNQNSEAIRQVGERFRKSSGADIRDAAELIRLKGF